MRNLIFAVCIFLQLPLHAEADPFLRGRACMVQEKYEPALKELEQALLDKPGDSELLYHIGICHFQLGDIEKARDAFYMLEKRRKGQGSFYLAKCEVRLNHPELAIKFLRIHLASRYQLPEKDILLDPDLMRLEKSSAWQSLWNEKEWYGKGEKDFAEAIFLKQSGRELEAINILNDLEKKGFNKSQVLEEKSDLYARLGNQKASQAALKNAVKSDVRNMDALEKLCSWQLEKGDWDDAIEGLNKVIRQEEDRFSAYLLRARASSAGGDLDAARNDVDLYIELFPEEAEAHYIKGLIEYEHGKYLSAIQSFHKALDLDGARAEYYFARGKTYAATNTLPSANRDLGMALDLDPYNGEIWFEKGLVNARQGQRQESCACLKKALQYGVYEAGEIIEKQCR